MTRRITVQTLQKMKQEKDPITMITAYDYPSAKIVVEAGAEVILVGDSLGMVVLGYDSTVPVTLQDMIHHTKAVVRGTKDNPTLIVADLPFLTAHLSRTEVLKAAGQLLQEGGAHAVKIEGGDSVLEGISACIQAGIPVMGHLGLMPQSVNQLGGYPIQGKDTASANKILDDAKKLAEIGVFSIVLECVPESLAKKVTNAVPIPVIGIGAGPHCDGQVLVFHDLLQYGSGRVPSFVKTYANLKDQALEGVAQYVQEVKTGVFPLSKTEALHETVKTFYGG